MTPARPHWLLSLLLLPCLSFAQSASAPSSLQLSAGASYSNNGLLKGVLTQPQWDLALNVDYRHGRLFANPLNGLGYQLVKAGSFNLGVSLNYLLGRDVKQDRRYQGLNDVHGALEPMLSIDWQPYGEVLDLYANYGKAISGSHGAQGVVGATLGFPVASKTTGYLDYYLTLSDQTYHQAYYGVSTQQSLTTAYTPFHPASGVTSQNLTLGINHQVNAQWGVVASLGQQRFGAAVANSPILTRRTSHTGSVMVTYQFW